MPPVRTFDVAPPLIMIVERDLLIGRRENNSACYKVFSRRSRKFFLGGRPFRDRNVAGRLNKLLKLPVRHCRCIHPETIHANAMNRTCVVRRHRHFMAAFTVYSGAHRELTAWNPDHALRCFARRGLRFRNSGLKRRRATECRPGY